MRRAIRLPVLFTVSAPGREWQGLEAVGPNRGTAVQAEAVATCIEPCERLGDLVQRFTVHLKQGKLELALNPGFRPFGFILDLAVLDGAFFTFHTDRDPNGVEDSSALILEERFQLSISV
jgi:hypothetical protein